MTYENALKQYIEATNTHKFENVKEMLHPHAVFWFTDKSCSNLEDIESYFTNAWDVIKDEVYRATDVKWITTNEQSATCLYTYQYEGYYKGQYVEGSGRATNVFIWYKGKWKLIHEHLSADTSL
ncbi:YybH family protein [Alkalihalobacillus trypoxylicola]|uniref:DUF4440 domain-containing protein n=1 Tax=Alkalihalobacillus trypoxylicola TaxID=519424 RepID=A0A161QC97_9BACI|nr:nuclear transport factor 2 family protein [Alkalihalobacillus trypoxylicola]KYG25572.1 DUF4440 domain-containing protein [Alkalihalobacillus trypoxylicola]